jgi:hypothetical protein
VARIEMATPIPPERSDVVLGTGLVLVYNPRREFTALLAPTTLRLPALVRPL